MADNILTSDTDFGIDLPEFTPPEDDIKEQQSMASFTKKPEYKRLKNHFEERIEFYQKYLPNGLEVGLDVAPTPEDWRVASCVIAEFNMVIGLYEFAKEVVKDAKSVE